jgi:hypothetical protein
VPGRAPRRSGGSDRAAVLQRVRRLATAEREAGLVEVALVEVALVEVAPVEAVPAAGGPAAADRRLIDAC